MTKKTIVAAGAAVTAQGGVVATAHGGSAEARDATVTLRLPR